MWKLIEGPKVVRAARKVVERFRDMTPARDDRDMQPARLERHRRALADGTFRPPEWASALCGEDEVEYRVNGKHTSHALAELDDAALAGHCVVVSRYLCPTLRDVAELYSTFDSAGSARGARDIYKVYAGSHPDLAGVPGFVVSLAAAGVAYSMWEDNYRARPLSQRAALILDNAPFVLWLNGAVAGADARFLRRVAVAAAMYKAWSRSHTAAGQFFGLVVSGESPNPQSPSRLIQRYLLATVPNRGQAAKPGRTTASDREMYVKTLHAWNAFRKGVQADLRYKASAKTPAAA